MDLERHNRRQIEMLNQRGGRTLSIVDLIQAGTISMPMAACAMRAVHEGASILTAARPGGAGKTTLLAALLNFLPSGEEIVTVDGPEVLGGTPAPGPKREALIPALSQRERGDSCGQQSEGGRRCYLVHEIGAGHWYGYLWGRDVARYLALVGGPRRIASCLHADTLEELTGILCSPPLDASRESLGRVGLVLFMHVSPAGRGLRRRVATMHEADGRGAHRLLFTWDPGSDAFRQTAPPREAEGLARYVEFIERFAGDGGSDAEWVRRKVLAFYGADRPS